MHKQARNYADPLRGLALGGLTCTVILQFTNLYHWATFRRYARESHEFQTQSSLPHGTATIQFPLESWDPASTVTPFTACWFSDMRFPRAKWQQWNHCCLPVIVPLGMKLLKLAELKVAKRESNNFLSGLLGVRMRGATCISTSWFLKPEKQDHVLLLVGSIYHMYRDFKNVTTWMGYNGSLGPL